MKTAKVTLRIITSHFIRMAVACFLYHVSPAHFLCHTASIPVSLYPSHSSERLLGLVNSADFGFYSVNSKPRTREGSFVWGQWVPCKLYQGKFTRTKAAFRSVLTFLLMLHNRSHWDKHLTSELGLGVNAMFLLR